MSYSTISLKIDERGVANLTLARPEKRNALSSVMIAELTDVAETLHASVDVRAVILDAEGSTFCAGGDLEWMKEQISASRAQRITEARKLAEMLYKLNPLPQPLIGKVNGNAFGGGVGLISVCDIVFCSGAVKFSLSEVRLGLIPATISPYVAARVGESNARQIALSARIFGADEARGFGLIAHVTTDLDAAADAEASRYLKLAPGAVAASKALFRSLGPKIDREVIDQTIERLADTWENPEALEGISAFFEKRSAVWTI